MKVTFYINWNSQEVYETEEELFDAYKRECIDDDDFDEFLEYNFRSSDIFNWNSLRKEEVLSMYQEQIIDRARDWADALDMKHTIDI